MNHNQQLFALSSLQNIATFAIALIAASTNAQEGDIWVYAHADRDKIGIGVIDESGSNFARDVRSFAQFFPDEYAADEPGVQSIGSETGTIPEYARTLPGDADLAWDFLPMKVNGFAGNLLYWDSNDSPSQVSFGPAPSSSYSLRMIAEGVERFAADGSDRLVVGGIIGTTESDDFLHAHPTFFLDDDHDENNATAALPGVYLASLRLRMDGLDRSDPLYIMWGTPGASGPSLEALSAAHAWVHERDDFLAPNHSADFDGDLDVEGADFMTWQRNVGAQTDALQIHGDANGDGAVTVADLHLLRTQFGSSLATFAGVHLNAAAMLVPEPASAVLATVAIAALVLGRDRRGPSHRRSDLLVSAV